MLGDVVGQFLSQENEAVRTFVERGSQTRQRVDDTWQLASRGSRPPSREASTIRICVLFIYLCT